MKIFLFLIIFCPVFFLCNRINALKENNPITINEICKKISEEKYFFQHSEDKATFDYFVKRLTAELKFTKDKKYKAKINFNLFALYGSLGNQILYKNEIVKYAGEFIIDSALVDGKTKKMLPSAYYLIAQTYYLSETNYSEAYNLLQQRIKLAEKQKNKIAVFKGYSFFTDFYGTLNEVDKALYYSKKSESLADYSKDDFTKYSIYRSIVLLYIDKNSQTKDSKNLDYANDYLEKVFKKIKNKNPFYGDYLSIKAYILYRKGNLDLAEKLINMALSNKQYGIQDYSAQADKMK